MQTKLDQKQINYKLIFKKTMIVYKNPNRIPAEILHIEDDKYFINKLNVFIT